MRIGSAARLFVPFKYSSRTLCERSSRERKEEKPVDRDDFRPDCFLDLLGKVQGTVHWRTVVDERNWRGKRTTQRRWKDRAEMQTSCLFDETFVVQRTPE